MKSLKKEFVDTLTAVRNRIPEMDEVELDRTVEWLQQIKAIIDSAKRARDRREDVILFAGTIPLRSFDVDCSAIVGRTGTLLFRPKP